jgi:hypothetical protein
MEGSCQSFMRDLAGKYPDSGCNFGRASFEVSVGLDEIDPDR